MFLRVKHLLPALPMLLLCLPANVGASEFFAHLYTRFEDGECLMFSWITVEDERLKLVFPGQKSEENGLFHCTVNIPAEDFEQFFANCFLSGLVFTGESGQSGRGIRGISFSGVPENSVGNKYFFEWYDAEHTDAEYLCLRVRP